LLGIKSITDVFNESSSFEDIGTNYDFFEMEETKIVSYKKKNQVLYENNRTIRI